GDSGRALISRRGSAFSGWCSAASGVVARLAVGVRLRRTALVGPPCGAVAELARSDSPRLSDTVALKQRLPCLPAWWPACGPTESLEPHPPGASSGLGIAGGVPRIAGVRDYGETDAAFCVQDVTLRLRV